MSMGWGAGRKAWQVLDNAVRVVAVELLCAVQGIEYRAPLRPSPATAAAMEAIRSEVPPLVEDRAMADEIETVAEMIEAGALDAFLG